VADDRLIAELGARLGDVDRDSWVSSQERKLVIGGSPGSGSSFQAASQMRAIGAAVQAGRLRSGGSTPWVRSSSVTNWRKTTGLPSVTK
jgi:hypothetical protein